MIAKATSTNLIATNRSSLSLGYLMTMWLLRTGRLMSTAVMARGALQCSYIALIISVVVCMKCDIWIACT